MSTTQEGIQEGGVARWADSWGPGHDHLHGWFGLSYAQYLTIPRVVLQSMPSEWQGRFARCLEELDATIDWRPEGGQYWVRLKDREGRFKHDPLMDYGRGGRRVPQRPTEEVAAHIAWLNSRLAPDGPTNEADPPEEAP